MVKDVSYAFRLLLRSPGYSLTVVLVLALGIGVNVLAFALFKALALTPLSGVSRSSELHSVVARSADGQHVALSYPDYRYLRDHDGAHAGLAGSLMSGYSLGRGVQARLIYGELVTGNYFSVLGVHAQLGRTLLPSDDVTPLDNPVAVLADALWRRSFGADPAIVGRTIELGTTRLTVIGVAEPEFRGSLAGLATEIYIPFAMQPAFSGGVNLLEDREKPLLYAFGRPRPHVTLASARTQAAVLSAQLAAAYPIDRLDARAVVLPMWQSPYGAQTFMLPAVSAMGATAALLLVAVCANVAGLVLVRSLSRRREIVARLALGATRAGVFRLLLVENLLLAVPGAWLGLQLPRVVAPFLERAQAGVSLPLHFNVEGTLVPGFALLLAIVSTVLYGLVPGLRASRVDLASAMKDEASPSSARPSRLRALLVLAQVATCLVLLVGTGLAVRTLEAARSADAGFDAADVASVALDVAPSGRSTAAGLAFYDRLLDALRADPRVATASVAKVLPLMMIDFDRREFLPEGYERQRGDDLRFLYNVIGPDYFRTLRIGLAAGREFNRRDENGALNAAIVNETLARRFWGGAAAAVGKRLRTEAWGPGPQAWLTIVGVARDVKYVRLNEGPRPYVYLPFSQAYNPTMFLQVRGSEASGAPVDLVRRRLGVHDPDQAIIMAGALADQTSMGLAVYDVTARALGIVGLVAMGLAALGIYGMVAFTVKHRVHEIGIRLAIGAPRGWILRRFLVHGLRLGAIGALVGIALAIAAARLMAALLYGISAIDGVSFALSATAVISIALAAAFAPAWRASRTDPLAALRRL